MTRVFRLNEDGSATPMPQLYAANEEVELQRLLEQNPSVLPGREINPEDPRRWLMIARELPVQDPESGSDRWSLDLFFSDQSAIPTLIECKRFKDTRSRREVVAQMLDYAANGHYYWEKDVLRRFAEAAAEQRGRTLAEVIRQLEPDTVDIDSDNVVDDYFDVLCANLREGQLRLIFYMEQSPYELRSIVEFLNKQMQRSEVLIVEAKTFEDSGGVVLVPSLFGYTEEARRVKERKVTVSSRSSRKWDRASFLEEIENKLPEDHVSAIKSLLSYIEGAEFEIRWGRGRARGSISAVAPSISGKSIFSVYTDGKLTLNFPWLDDTDDALNFRERYFAAAQERLAFGTAIDDVSKYPSVPVAEWGPRVSEVIEFFSDITKTSRSQGRGGSDA